MNRYEVEIRRASGNVTIFRHATLKEARRLFARWTTVERKQRSVYKRGWKPVTYTLRTIHDEVIV